MTTLSKQQSDIAIALGQQDGSGLIDDIKQRVRGFGTDEEKLLWWASFMGYMGGICGAELGPGALEAIQQMTAKTTGQLLQQKAN